MQYAESVVDLVGNTPLVRLTSVTRDLGPDAPLVLAKLEYLNPGGSVKDRIAVRMVDAAEASGALQPGGTIVEPTSGNTGIGLALVAQQRGYTCIFICPDKVGQEKINVLKAYGAEVVVCPTAVDPSDPRSYYSVSDRLARETPGRLEARPVLQPGEPAVALRDHRPGDLGADRRPDHHVRDRHGHRRHDQRHRPVPQGGLRREGARRRRRPRGLGLLRRHRPALPGRGRRRGLLALHLRPRDRRRDHPRLRRRLLRHDPAARPRGGPAGRRLLRDGRRRGPARRAEKLTKDDVVVVLLPDGGRGYLNKIFSDKWMADYGFLESATGETVGELLHTKSGETPTLVHTHPNETVREAIDILREYGVSQLPVVRAEPPVTAGEVVGSVDEQTLLDALFAGRATLADRVEKHMSEPLPIIGSGEPVTAAVAALGVRRRAAGARRRQAGRRRHPAGRAGSPRRGHRDERLQGFNTRAIHAGQEPDPATGAVILPVHLTTTYKQDGVGGLRGGYEYSRSGNPTRTALHEALAALEEGTTALAFASGLAAEDTLLRTVCRPGRPRRPRRATRTAARSG